MHRKILFVIVLAGAAANYGSAQFDFFVPQVVAGKNTPDDRAHFFRTQFHIINLSGDPTEIEIRTLRDDGQDMPVLRTSGVGTGGGRTSRLSFPLAPLGQKTIATLNNSFREVGWASVRSTVPIGIVVTLQYLTSGSGEVVTSTSLLPDAPTKAFSSYALINFLASSTGLAVLNPSHSELASVTIRLLDQWGRLKAERIISLGPREKIARLLGETGLFPDVNSFFGSIEVSSSIPLAATVIRLDRLYQTNWVTFPAAPARPQTDSTAPVKYFVPQVVDGRDQVGTKPAFDYRTGFAPLNLANADVSVTIETKDSRGEPLQAFRFGGLFAWRWLDRTALQLNPLGVASEDTDINTASKSVGWAEITASGPTALVVTLTATEVAGSRQSVTSLIPDPPTDRFVAHALISPVAATGLALLNPSAESTLVLFELHDGDGQVVGRRGVILPARSKIAQFLNEGELFKDLENFEGSVHVSSTLPIAATVIRVDGIYWSTFRIFPKN